MMGHELHLDSILRIGISRNGLMASSCAGKVVHDSHEVSHALHRLMKDCWAELNAMREIHRGNMDYYKRFGGYCPDSRPLVAYRDKIVALLSLAGSIREEADEIKVRGWFYDIGYQDSICMLLDALVRMGYSE